MQSMLVASALAALISLADATPAAKPPATSPLRHLEYRFDVHKYGMSGEEFDPEVEGGGTSESGEGGSGTMYVDVLSFTSDGALSVRIWEQVDEEPRPRSAFTCNVYGNTTVACPKGPAAPSPAEWLLLSYLGRQFVDAAPWDARHHWSRTESTPQFVTQEDFSRADGRDGNHVVVREEKTISLRNGGFSSQTENIEITYDRPMEVPDSIHDELSSTGGGESTGHETFDFHLRSDSLSKS